MKPWGLLTLLGLLSSCGDLAGLFWSDTDVDIRFEESQGLPAPADIVPPGDFSLVLTADLHMDGADHPNFIRLGSHLLPEDTALIMVGDLTQSGSEADFSRVKAAAFATGLTPFFALGNHDLWNSGWKNFRQVLGPSHWSVSVGPVRIICLDSANGTLGRPQLDWLRRELASKTEAYSIVVSHMNLFAGSTGTTVVQTDPEQGYLLMSLYEDYGVDLVVMGHDHQYREWKTRGVRYINLDAFTPWNKSPKLMRVSYTGGTLGVSFFTNN